MNSLEKVLSAIGDGNYKQRGDTHDCKCPAHDDQNASLSVTYNHQSQSVLLYCHAGCKNQHILNVLIFAASMAIQQNTLTLMVVGD